MKYPAVWLMEESRAGEILSVAFAMMISIRMPGRWCMSPEHLVAINPKSIYQGHGRSSYRGLRGQGLQGAENVKSNVVCDAQLLTKQQDHTYPYIENREVSGFPSSRGDVF